MACSLLLRAVATSVALACVVMGGTTGCLSTLTRSAATGGPASPLPTGSDGRSPASYFRVGDCIQDPPKRGGSAKVVDCSEPHLVEVYGVFMLPDGAFPGDATVKEYKAKCPDTARKYMTEKEGMDPANGRTVIEFPDEDSWALGDRSVTCFVDLPAPRTGALGAGKWSR